MSSEGPGDRASAEKGSVPPLGRPRPGHAVGDYDPKFLDAIAPPFRRLYSYCRVEVEGFENLPKSGAIVVANHTGWVGLDHANLFLTIYDRDGRVLRTAVHPAWFRLPGFREVSPRLGFFEVSVAASTRILDSGGLVLFFPEAEDGNFKPIWKRYQLQTFKPGFARVALAADATIVPVVIVGGEDANPSLFRLDATKDLFGVALPFPVNVLPFPARWRIKFMEPIPIEQYLLSGDAVDVDLAGKIARDVRERMQKELREQLRRRGSVFFGPRDGGKPPGEA